jgi:hypothetical protein
MLAESKCELYSIKRSVILDMIGNISKSKGFRGDDGKDGYTPAISFRYDEATGNLYYSSDGIMVDKEYIDSINLASKDFVVEKLLELSNKVAPSPASITLYADRWEQDEGEIMWHQEVVVANATITPYSKVDIQLSAEQIAIFYEKDLAFVTENDGGKVTVYSIGRVPENDYILQATVSEVVLNG